MSGKLAEGHVTSSQQQAVRHDNAGNVIERHTHTSANQRQMKNGGFYKATSAADAPECTTATVLECTYTGSRPRGEKKEGKKVRVGQSGEKSCEIHAPTRAQ